MEGSLRPSGMYIMYRPPPRDVTNLYHGKSIEHLTRFEDRNNVWPKLMVSYKFM